MVYNTRANTRKYRVEIFGVAAFLTIVCLIIACFKARRSCRIARNDANKFFEMYALTAQWMRNKQEGLQVCDSLLAQGYRRICIYGMGYLGDMLCDDLRETDVEIAYAVDMNAGVVISNSNRDIKVISNIDEAEVVDAMIVTVPNQFDFIKQEVMSKKNMPILSIEQLIYERGNRM